MRRFAFSAALSLLVAPHNAAAQDGPVAFVNATVVDIERGVLVPRQTIVTSRGRIDEVGPAATTRVPRGATRVDVAGRFVIPGLWDMHVHIGGVTGDVGASVGYYGSLFLANGVTGVRDAGGDAARLTSMDSIGRVKPGSMPRMIQAGAKIGPASGESWSLASVQPAIDARLQALQAATQATPSGSDADADRPARHDQGPGVFHAGGLVRHVVYTNAHPAPPDRARGGASP